MGIYGRNYSGRIYTFKVIDIQDNVVYLQNMETFGKSKVNISYIDCRDGFIKVGDYITRQHTSSGVGLYSKGFGSMDITSRTVYTNTTSTRRDKDNKPWFYALCKIISLPSIFALAFLSYLGGLGIIIYFIGMIVWVFRAN